MSLDDHLVAFQPHRSAEYEHYLALRYELEKLRTSRDLAILAVTSPGVGDGKTTTAINLAGVLAHDLGARVLLVDADLRKPAIGSRMGLCDRGDLPGLMDLIRSPERTLDEVIQPGPKLNLMILPAGRWPTLSGGAGPDAPPDITPAEMLRSSRFAELLAAARTTFTYVVLDTPPILPVPDARLIEQAVDGMILVVAAHRTRREALADALGAMSPAKMLGLVFNGDTTPLSDYYAYYYQHAGGPVRPHPSSGASA
jgi:capsular exopolysaccharide synthesis family protein